MLRQPYQWRTPRTEYAWPACAARNRTTFALRRLGPTICPESTEYTALHAKAWSQTRWHTRSPRHTRLFSLARSCLNARSQERIQMTQNSLAPGWCESRPPGIVLVPSCRRLNKYDAPNRCSGRDARRQPGRRHAIGVWAAWPLNSILNAPRE